MSDSEFLTGFLRKHERIELWEYEMRQGSAVASEIIKKAVLGLIEAGDSIPEILIPHALSWIEKGTKKIGRGRPSQRDRDRALYFHLMTLDDRGEEIKAVCKGIAKNVGGDWTTYRNAYRRLCKAPPKFLYSGDIPNMAKLKEFSDRGDKLIRKTAKNLQAWFAEGQM